MTSFESKRREITTETLGALLRIRLLGLLIFAFLILFFENRFTHFLEILVFAGVSTGISGLLWKMGKSQLAAALLIAADWLLVTLLSLAENGLDNPTITLYLIIIAMATILLSTQVGGALIIASILATWGMQHFDTTGWLPGFSLDYSPRLNWMTLATIYLTSGVMLGYLVSRMDFFLRQAVNDQATLAQQNAELSVRNNEAKHLFQALQTTDQHLLHLISNMGVAYFMIDALKGWVAPPNIRHTTEIQSTIQMLLEDQRLLTANEIQKVMNKGRHSFELNAEDRVYEIRCSLFETRGRILAVGIDITEARQREIQFKNLLQINEAVTGQLDRSRLMDLIVKAILEIDSNAEACSIFLYNAEEDLLVESASAGWPADAAYHISLRPDESLSGKVFHTGKPLIVDDFETLPEDLRQQLPGVPRARAALAVRLDFNDTPIGVLTAYNFSTTDAFNNDDLTLLLSCAAPAAASIAAANAHNRALREHERATESALAAIQAQEETQRRIGAALHDDYGQVMMTLLHDLEFLKSNFDVNPEIDSRIDQITHKVHEATDGLRQFSSQLRPTILLDVGLKAALQHEMKRFRMSDTQPELKIKGRLQKVPDDLAVVIYRSVQEAATNTLRYAREASRFMVNLNLAPESLTLTIKDDGPGFDPEVQKAEAGLKPGGNGLSIMRERIRLLGGKSRLETSLGHGVCVTIELPLINWGIKRDGYTYPNG
jgi:signal transduction histidine kinase